MEDEQGIEVDPFDAPGTRIVHFSVEPWMHAYLDWIYAEKRRSNFAEMDAFKAGWQARAGGQ